MPEAERKNIGDMHICCFPFRLPFGSMALEMARPFLFLPVERNHGMALPLEWCACLLDMLTLDIAVRVRRAFHVFLLGTERGALGASKPADGGLGHLMSHGWSGLREVSHALARPCQHAHRIFLGFLHLFQITLHCRILLHGFFSSATFFPLAVARGRAISRFSFPQSSPKRMVGPMGFLRDVRH